MEKRIFPCRVSQDPGQVIWEENECTFIAVKELFNFSQGEFSQVVWHVHGTCSVEASIINVAAIM